MNELVRFSFSLSPRMQVFLMLRDGLRCLGAAEQSGQPYLWLQACVDVRASLLGEQGRKPALPEVIGLFAAMRQHLESLAGEHPRFRASIEASCEDIDSRIQTLREIADSATRLLGQDALIETYYNALKKQDWLAHKPCLPQSLATLWHGSGERQQRLHEELAEIMDAVHRLDNMLHDYVMWERRTASDGHDQIIPERGIQFGLIVIGLAPAEVSQGIVPDISGNRLAIRLRFQQWLPGMPTRQVSDHVDYAMMLVPIA